MSTLKFIYKHVCETSVEYSLEDFLILVQKEEGENKIPLTDKERIKYTKLFETLSQRKDQRVVLPYTLGEYDVRSLGCEYDEQIRGWCEDKVKPKGKSLRVQWDEATLKIESQK